MAERAAQEGYRVIVHDREDSDELKALERSLPNGQRTHFDVTHTYAMQEALRILQNEIGQIDILVNNAGVIARKEFIEHSYEEIEQILRVNLEAMIKITRCCLPFIREGVVNMASAAGKESYPKRGHLRDQVVYATSKFGVRGFSIALAQAVPHLQILCVNPGPIATQMHGFNGASPNDLAEAIFGEIKKPSAQSNFRELDIFW